jgi:hypothetical protein
MSLEDDMTPEDKLILYAVLQDIADELRRIEREEREERKAQRSKAKATEIDGAPTQVKSEKPQTDQLEAEVIAGDSVCLQPADIQRTDVNCDEKSSQTHHMRDTKRKRSKVIESDNEIAPEALFSFLYGD